MTIKGGNPKRRVRLNTQQPTTNPIISVVTVVYNGEQYLQRTIESVTNQTYPAIEYILIDGGSTDRTLQIIRQFEQQIDYWQSEPDEGIADAMNKGLSLSSGQFILFIHADDYLTSPDSLAQAATYLDRQHDIFAFDIFYGRHHILKHPRGMNVWMNFKTGILHQGALCSRSLFNEIGSFDTQFKIAMDYDFFLRAYRQRKSTKKCGIPVAVMGDDGISAQTDHLSLIQRLSEEKKIHYNNALTPWMHILYATYWILYMPYKLKSTTIRQQIRGQS